MIDYSKGKIYTIRSHQTDDIYIGSTTQSLSERLRGHKKKFNSWTKNGKGNYVTSYEIVKYDDAYIELLEDCECERKEQLLKREGKFIREMDCVNKQVAGRSKKEYDKEYGKLERERWKEYYIKYQREENGEKWNEDKEQRKCYNKHYYQENREKEKGRTKQYREENRDEVNKKKREKVICKCGVSVSKSGLARHRKRGVHQAYLKSLNKT